MNALSGIGPVGDLSEHFSRYEFACKCGCGEDTVDYEELNYLERIRKHFGSSVTINSAHRCYKYNRSKTVGSNDESQHPKARASDIVVDGVDPSDVADYAEEIGIPGVGRYNSFTHIDSRTHGLARW